MSTLNLTREELILISASLRTLVDMADTGATLTMQKSSAHDLLAIRDKVLAELRKPAT
jgi:hypothetical protein